jgi:hypothetical protein
LEDDPFNKEKRQMAKWNRTIAAASLLAALCPGVALAQAVEDVDGQRPRGGEPKTQSVEGGQRVCRSTAGRGPEEDAREDEAALPLGAGST